MSAARTVRRPLAFLTRRHAASTADFWRMDVWYSCGVIHGGGGRVQTAVAVALSGAAEALVCRLAAQRRASCAWRAEPRPRARAPRPWPRARARCARAWRSESHRIAEVLFIVVSTTILSVTVGLCPQPTLSCHSILRFFRRTVGLCPHCRTSLLSTTCSGTRLPVAVLLRQLWNFCFMACCSATLRNHHALEMRLPLLSCVA